MRTGEVDSGGGNGVKNNGACLRGEGSSSEGPVSVCDDCVTPCVKSPRALIISVGADCGGVCALRKCSGISGKIQTLNTDRCIYGAGAVSVSVKDGVAGSGWNR